MRLDDEAKLYIRRGRVRRNNWRKGVLLSINSMVSDKKTPLLALLPCDVRKVCSRKSMQFTKFIRIVTCFLPKITP